MMMGMNTENQKMTLDSFNHQKISMFENLSPDKSFSNKIEINKKRLIHDLIKEKLVEGENKWFLH